MKYKKLVQTRQTKSTVSDSLETKLSVDLSLKISCWNMVSEKVAKKL